LKQPPIKKHTIMSADQEEPNQDRQSFCDKLQGLRLKIDLLPESQRPHLIGLAEAIARQHKRFQERKETTPERSSAISLRHDPGPATELRPAPHQPQPSPSAQGVAQS
jgi:hypothetical protein